MSPTIFMIHGMWGGPWYWANYRSLLEARGFRCIATTLPWHDMEPGGKPDARLGTTSLRDYTNALAAEIEALDEKPVLLGHSMGGLLAQMLAARGLARAAVLLTPASPAGIIALAPSVIRGFWSIQTKWGFWRNPMRQTRAEAAWSMLNRLPPDQHAAILDQLVYESGRAAFEIGYWPLDSRKTTRVAATEVTCPLLVIAGSEDRLTPASVVRKVADKYRTVSTYREFPGHAHWIVAEPGWEQVAGEIGDWVQNLPAAT